MSLRGPRDYATRMLLTPPASPAPEPMRLALVVVAAALGGGINAIAGGGTLLTFPALVALGIPAIVANATSTVALWPGAVSSMLGYRAELKGSREWVIRLAAPSIIGGLVGAWLLLRTPAKRFDTIVPWLVFGATLLFVIQRPAMRWIRGHSHHEREEPPTLGVLLFYVGIGIYGGYFGAGIGILMLAALGLIGLTDMHEMNGLKNLLALCINGIAMIWFAISGAVLWKDGAIMAVAAIAGGYLGARIAHRLGRRFVRNFVVIIGLTMTLALFVKA